MGGKLQVHAASINLEELFNRVDNDQALLVTLIRLYRDDAPHMLDAIDRACQDRDGDALLRAAHTMKGATAVFATAPAVACAQAMEQAAHDLDWPRAVALQDAVRAEIASLMDNLAALSAQCAP